MKLIFGGAYQGKLEYALTTFGSELTSYKCDEHTVDFNHDADILIDYHLLVLAQLRKDIDPCAYIDSHREALRDKIILCDDISCGVVPMKEELRRWREAVGRCMGLLTKHAERVDRVFCGLGRRLK